MVSEERRRWVRQWLLSRARADQRITGAALTGSAARGTEDAWSDVDLFFGAADGICVDSLLAEWSAHVYRELGAVHHFDLRSGPTVYRAFLLAELLEIDLGFTSAEHFGPHGDGGFRVVFGAAAPPRDLPFDAAHLTGLAWHHVLHARISLERGRYWQAEHWISALRDHTLALACHRLGLPASHARGADRLPPEITGRAADALVRTLEPAELARALRAATAALRAELRTGHPETAAALEPPLLALTAFDPTVTAGDDG